MKRKHQLKLAICQLHKLPDGKKGMLNPTADYFIINDVSDDIQEILIAFHNNTYSYRYI